MGFGLGVAWRGGDGGRVGLGGVERGWLVMVVGGLWSMHIKSVCMEDGAVVASG